jgi:hypothetical protein
MQTKQNKTFFVCFCFDPITNFVMFTVGSGFIFLLGKTFLGQRYKKIQNLF